MILSQDVFKKSVQFVKKVGPKRAKIFKKLDISTIADLIYHFPRRYEDRRHLLPISKLKINQYQTLEGKIITTGLRYTRKGPAIFEAVVGDETGNLLAIWFNQPYLKDKFSIGDKVILYGKVEAKKGRLVIVNPEYELMDEVQFKDSIHTGRIVPIYPLTSGISQRQLRTVIKGAIDLYAYEVPEILPSDLRHRLKLVHISAALKNIHFPKNEDFYLKARKRLVFDEFFLIEVINAYTKKKIKNRLRGIKHRNKRQIDKLFSSLVPFELTPSQKKVIEEIKEDMIRPKPMYRLLQGDVGSGKTIIAFYAVLLSILNGYQTAFMVPTEILAEQHFFLFKKMLSKLPYKAILVKGKIPDRERTKIYKEIQEKKVDVIIGTHALIQQGIKFKKLSLCIIDEQHKFGVLQRKALKEKGINPDILVMTATPIPRTLSMVLYSDMDLSVIKELPPGRKPITTWWVTERKRIDAYNFIKKEIQDKGKQAYIVYPIIEKSQSLDLRDATRMYKHLKDDIFKEFKVGLIHGRLSSRQKESIMRDFKAGKINILISTIVIEVGIDIANASIMLIEHAERFGLAQLHQLRGRVGRGDFKSYCILVSDTKTQDAKSRLNAMIKCQDGFEIAERDLKIRGPGEVFGVRQHGFPEFKIADLERDLKILELAKKEAFSLIDSDPLLNWPQHRQLHKHIKVNFNFI
jgi:ATP-dependent DNA helicase RecG